MKLSKCKEASLSQEALMAERDTGYLQENDFLMRCVCTDSHKELHLPQKTGLRKAREDCPGSWLWDFSFFINKYKHNDPFLGVIFLAVYELYLSKTIEIKTKPIREALQKSCLVVMEVWEWEWEGLSLLCSGRWCQSFFHLHLRFANCVYLSWSF